MSTAEILGTCRGKSFHPKDILVNSSCTVNLYRYQGSKSAA